jgi:hypothetical protein
MVDANRPKIMSDLLEQGILAKERIKLATTFVTAPIRKNKKISSWAQPSSSSLIERIGP